MNTFFIAGAQRSGTTLLSVLLSKHPDIDIEGNSVAFRLVSCYGYYKDVLPYNLSYSRDQIQSWLIKNDYKGRLSELLDDNNLDQYPDARITIAKGIENRLKLRGKKVFGDKSPEIEYFIPRLLMLIPDAKFVHVVRDGRAVAYSHHTRANKNLLLAAQEWVDSNILGLYNQAMIGEERYKLVSYERLLKEPETTIKDLCQFLEVEYIPEIILENKNIDNEKSYVKSTLDLSKIDAYKDGITSKQLKKIEKIQAPLLKRLGYDLLHPIQTDKYRQMSILKKLWLRQIDNFKQLFISKKMGMINRKNVEVSIPFKTRLKTYVFMIGYDLLPEKVFKRLFRKRWIKEVYIDKITPSNEV